MIVLFTDFGIGPYVGQMEMVLAREAPGIPVVNLMHDAPSHDPRRAAYLLAALTLELAPDAIVVGVVDPGVGGDRDAIVVQADGRRFVGPDNGLFEPVHRRAAETRAWSITWRPETLSASFHGRDLFAPVAAMIAKGASVPGSAIATRRIARPDWPDDLDEIAYIDHYGNAMTGRRAATLPPIATAEAAGVRVARAETFSSVAPGEPFWYENANGLAEIAVNQGRAADRLGLALGDTVIFHR